MRSFSRFFISLVLVLFAGQSFAQQVFKRDMSIPVEDSIPLRYAWFGGLNNPMFSNPDLNHDGIPDLVIFDESDNHILTFLNNGTPDEVDYVFAPEYKQGFPKVTHWMLMGDFNCDGIKDLFVWNPAQIDLWLGRYNAENRLEFDSSFALLYKSTTGMVKVFVTPYDVPAISDINGDGDLDLLLLNETASEPRTVYYYENQSREATGACGAIDSFSLVDQCWGNFVETGVSLSVAIDSCGFFKMEQSAGTNGVKYAFATFDEDGDRDKELLMGLSISSKINRMLNDGTSDSAHVSVQDIAYPSYDVSYGTEYFSTPSLLDVNNDGLEDLLIAPRMQESENYSCAWYYQNMGTADSALFHLQTKTFLIHEGLDFGEGAYPAFFDYNGDGLLDLVVGNVGYYRSSTTFRPGLALLENTGTPTSPKFKLIDRDFANTSTRNIEAVAPTFGDMDNDGDADMIIGRLDGYLDYYENIAAPGAPASFIPAMIEMFGIDVGNSSTPFIHDVNGDSLLDLVVGEMNGNLNYFENKGTRTAFQFNTQPDNSYFGKVRILTPPLSTSGYPTPFISRLDTSGKKYLVVGSEAGTIKMYEFNPDSIYSGSFRQIFDSIPAVDEGIRTAVAVADLNNDGKMEMVIGNYRGGLSLFSQIDSFYTGFDIPERSLLPVEVIPNPANHFVKLILPENHQMQRGRVELYDIIGKKVMSKELDLSAEQLLELPNVQTGIYFLVISESGNTAYKKLVINH